MTNSNIHVKMIIQNTKQLVKSENYSTTKIQRLFMKEFDYLTIRQTAAKGIISEFQLRSMLKEGELPGFYSGNTYKVNVPMLIDKLDAISAANGGMQQ